jgi:hypothetical protein
MSLGILLRKELQRIARHALKPTTTRLHRTQRNLAQLRQIVRKQKRTLDSLERLRARKGGGAPRLTLSPKRRAVLRLQGQYMGRLRGLPARQKARVKALRTSKGFPAAIRLAKKLARG